MLEFASARCRDHGFQTAGLRRLCTESISSGILARVGGGGMGTDEGDRRARGWTDHVEPVDLENPYPSPIVVSTGKGSYLRLPTPGPVVEGLGGPSRLNERLRAILVSGPYVSREAAAHDTAALTAHYDEFLQLLEVGSDPAPVHLDEGWSVIIPIPETVVEGLGGSSQLNERLASMYLSAPRRPTGVDAVTTEKLTAQYDRLLGQIETVINRPEY
jgi:hypothetical protein